MSTLSSVEQKVYKKVMASKKKVRDAFGLLENAPANRQAMTQSQIEIAIPGLSKKDCMVAINKIIGVVRSLTRVRWSRLTPRNCLRPRGTPRES